MLTDIQNGKRQLVMELEQKVGAPIIRAGMQLSQGTMQQLNDQKRSYEHVLENLQDQAFSAEQEKVRTEKILAEMVKRISSISKAATDRDLDESQIMALATHA